VYIMYILHFCVYIYVLLPVDVINNDNNNTLIQEKNVEHKQTIYKTMDNKM